MRIFKIDVSICPKCGCDMEIRAAVNDRESIRRYLRHIGLPEDPPPIAPARDEQRVIFDDVQTHTHDYQ